VEIEFVFHPCVVMMMGEEAKRMVEARENFIIVFYDVGCWMKRKFLAQLNFVFSNVLF